MKLTENDTIAAIATALSPSGIGIVRISGPEAFAVAGRVFGDEVTRFESHTVHYGFVRDPETGRTVDEVLMLVMKAPRTYTREDTVEIDCHGGVLVTKRVLEAVLAAGARLAEPGEFTRRAYLNGRIDLSQAEAVAGIISAKNDLALRNSVRQLRGREREEIMRIRAEILREIAQIEATLDDPEHLSFDGFDEVVTTQTEAQLRSIRKLIETAEDGRRIREGIRTVIVGRPNVGKSSLLNALLGEDRAIVTEIAGTTRDTLTEEVRMRGITLLLVDTAGIRTTDDAVERIGVERARRAVEEADLILWVVDGSEPLSEDDCDILAACAGKPVIPLLNKSDLAAVTDETALRSMISQTVGEQGSVGEPLAVSAKTEDGLTALEERITSLFFSERIAADDECVITSERQRSALVSAEESLRKVRESIAAGMPEDFYTIDLTAAYETLGTILGEEPDEDVINMIFSEFCLGK